MAHFETAVEYVETAENVQLASSDDDVKWVGIEGRENTGRNSSPLSFHTSRTDVCKLRTGPFSGYSPRGFAK